MSDEERRTLVVTAVVLLAASLFRFAWEVRPLPPILPPEPIPAELVEATRAEVEAAERMRTPLAPGERIDPNRDPEVELARLPGVGPALSRRIIEDREAEGPYRSLADLQRVSGIGPATADRLAPHLDFSNPPAVTVSPVDGGPDRWAVPSGWRTPAFPGGGGGAAAGARGLDPPLNLNSATADALEGLPGIGPALASRIVDFRLRAGGFRQVDDLLEVSGIGPATLERIRPFVWVTP